MDDITPRDYFAAFAMQAIALAVTTTAGAAEAALESDLSPDDYVASKAYAFADSMLRAREKK